MAEGTVQQPADPENPKITGLGTNSNIRGITHRYPRPGASKLCQRATYAEKGGGDSRPAKASQPVEKSFRPGYPRDAWRRYPHECAADGGRCCNKLAGQKIFPQTHLRKSLIFAILQDQNLRWL